MIIEGEGGGKQISLGFLWGPFWCSRMIFMLSEIGKGANNVLFHSEEERVAGITNS